ncbi:hypothetical protein M3M33_16775, partial [Loigolactobacillus coryniformis]|uniref:hypothetical protein n=1 Tax=Loigolactobacillus coryniformis TaxID=1610 RepID=UPI00201A47FE
AIANDVQMFAKMNGVKLDKSMLDALTGTRGTEEQNLVNDLRALNQQEKAAQDALIAVEVENTNAMTNLLTSINALINTIG